jgi:hypothetical protein
MSQHDSQPHLRARDRFITLVVAAYTFGGVGHLPDLRHARRREHADGRFLTEEAQRPAICAPVKASGDVAHAPMPR